MICGLVPPSTTIINKVVY